MLPLRQIPGMATRDDCDYSINGMAMVAHGAKEWQDAIPKAKKNVCSLETIRWYQSSLYFGINSPATKYMTSILST